VLGSAAAPSLQHLARRSAALLQQHSSKAFSSHAAAKADDAHDDHSAPAPSARQQKV